MGYDMIAVPEHFIIPNNHVDLSGPHYFHAAAAQAYFAGATENIRINSCIAILPLQNPIVTAKALATADWMSSGRVIATFGVGWLKKEFDILGVPFQERETARQTWPRLSSCGPRKIPASRASMFPSAMSLLNPNRSKSPTCRSGCGATQTWY